MKNKTYKREVALILFMFLGYLAYVGETDIVEILAWPTFTFGGLAFGLDWKSKLDNKLLKSTS